MFFYENVVRSLTYSREYFSAQRKICQRIIGGSFSLIDEYVEYGGEYLKKVVMW